jgi:hypothetical protein
MINAHCYLINSKYRDWWLKQFDNVGWHTFDWWLNFVFERSNEKMPIFKNIKLTSQISGYSQIDNVERLEK